MTDTLPFLLLLLLLAGACGEAQDVREEADTTDSAQPTPVTARLEQGYVLCESAAQLRWFIDVQTASESFEPQPSPWTMTVHPDGSAASRSEAVRAHQEGWCTRTDEMETFRVEILEDCDDAVPLPNGGCRQFRMAPAGLDHWTTWYTFADAITETK